MKNIKYMLILFISVVYAQKDTINVNLFTSTQLIFPTNVEKVKISTKNAFIIYDKDDNIVILQSKATKDEYSNSNVFIVTDDKLYYNFLLTYKENVKSSFFIKEYQSLNYNEEEYLLNKDTLKIKKNKKLIKIKSKEKFSETSIDKILKDKYVLKKAYIKEADVRFQMCNNYYHDNKSYYKVYIENKSTLDYDLKFLKFRIETIEKKSKKSLITKEIEEDEYIIHGDTEKTILPGEKRYLIFEFSKLTLNKEEFFTMEFKEKSGNRDALLSLPSYLTNDPHLLTVKKKKKNKRKKQKS
jgi:hypothetical protein